MFKVLVEMSSQTGDNYKKGAGHASTGGEEGSDFNTQLCCQLSELPWGQCKVVLTPRKKKSWWEVCWGETEDGAELHRTARLHEEPSSQIISSKLLLPSWR